MHVETHTSLEAIADEWDRLADRAGESPFLRPGWFSAWWAAFRSGRPEIVALRRDGDLVAIAPFVRREGGLESPTNWHTPEFGLLAEDADAERALAEALIARRPRRLTVRFLNSDETDLAACRQAAETMGYRILTRTLERSPYVPLDGGWDAYERSLDTHLLAEVRRRRRRLEEQGTVSFHLEDGSERLDALLEQGFRVEGSGWKEENGTAISSRPETRTFYTDVARWAASRGWLRLAFLRLDDRPLAFFFLVSEGGAVYHLKGGYDQAFKKYAPGMLITRDVLRWAFAHGLSRYEFLGDEEPFKLQWTREVRERMLLQAFTPSLVGVAQWAAYRYGRPLAKRALAFARR